MSTLSLRAYLPLGPVAQLVLGGFVVLASAGCGTTEFAAAGDAGVDGSTAKPDAKGGRDSAHEGSDAGMDARPGDGGKHDTSVSDDTGTPPDTGADHDTGTGHDSGAPRDAGVDQGGPTCAGGACTGAGSCPPPAEQCKEAACTDGCCGTKDKPAETACTNATGGRVCDGAGACVDCVSNADCTTSSAPYCALHACVECRTRGDCPAPDSNCETPICSAAGVCGVTTATQGSSCTSDGGRVCNSSGMCVGCNSMADCTAGIPTPCEMPTCTGGVCTETDAPAGTSCGTGLVCNSSGGCCPAGGGVCIVGG